MKKGKLLALLSLLVLVTGCGTNANPDGANSASSDGDSSGISSSEESAAASSTVDPDSMAGVGTELSEDELTPFTDMFASPEYHGFLDESFNSIAEINWDTVVGNGSFFDSSKVSKDDKAAYLKAKNLKQLDEYTELLAIKGDALEEYITAHTGEEYKGDKKPISWTYVEDNNTYYYEGEGGTPYENTYTCIAGKQSGNDYTLTFKTDSFTGKHSGKDADRVLKLTKTDEGVTIKSNAIQWENLSDEELTFDVELVPGDNPAKFITYPADPAVEGDNISFVVVKDGKLETEISSFFIRENNSGNLDKVTAVDAFDYNADGKKDFVIIGESNGEPRILLTESINLHSGYYDCSAAEGLEKELADEFTTDKIRALLIGEKEAEKFDSYKDAYIQIAKLSKLTSDNFKYALINADGDDVPELVIDNPDYGVSLYTFDNGYTHCLMNHWGYGVSGNAGYYYAEGKGVYHNANYDYVDAVQYMSYMTAREDAEIATDYSVKNIMFDDLNGNGMLDGSEIAPENELTIYSTIYSNFTDKNLSEEQIKEKVAQYESLEYKQLEGTMTCDELLDQLNQP